MDKPYILTTSGFILPENNLYGILTEEEVADVSIFNRTAFVNINSALADLIKPNGNAITPNRICHSIVANKAYKQYEASGSFEDYMSLVDIASEILPKVNYDTFFEIQAHNRNMSPFSFNMCVDLFGGKFLVDYVKYNTMPFNVRFSLDNGLTSNDIIKNINRLKFVKTNMCNTWEKLLTNITNDRTAFVTFFKYVFVDSY